MKVNTNDLLDRIFGDQKVKYRLDLFDQQEKKRLQLFEQGKKIRIRCMVRDRDFIAKPEEIVRQLVLIRLHYTFGYPIAHLNVEVSIKMGSGYAKKLADIVVYRAPHKITPYIIVEVKKPGRKDGREQLHSYMNATGAPFGMWTNGSTGMQGVSYELRTEPNLYAGLPRLPAVDESLDDVLEPIRKKDLKPADDLIALVKQMQEEVLANAGVNVFEEVFKLFFVKLWDEENASDLPDDDSSICRFRITADEPEQQVPRFKQLLDEACDSYSDIFPVGTEFDLSPEALMVAASVLERVRLTDTDLELVDLTFEYLMSPESKGDKGQYFTPRQVIRMAVKMLNPHMDETVLDPACGPCGFPIQTLLHVRDHELRRKWPTAWRTRIQTYGQRHLFASDFDKRVVRVGKFMMRLAGDGRTNVYRMNSLDQREWKRDQAFQRDIATNQFDIIMTNPLFAGTIRHPQILNNYDLAFNETRRQSKTKDELTFIRERKQQSRRTRDVLFLDFCLNKLTPSGRMAIVLPQGHFNNISAEQTRRYIMSRARILAVVGLHVNAFKPHTGTKTSVLFVQKWARKEAAAWRTWYDDLYEHDRQVAAFAALSKWREKELAKKKTPTSLPTQIQQEPQHPGDPPCPPGDYPIFFATSQRSGRDNSGKYDWLKDDNGNIQTAQKMVLVHDEQGQTVEATRETNVLNTDLDEIADAFIAWGKEQNLHFLTDSPYNGRSFSEHVVGANFDASTISINELERTRRIDSEYYRARFIELEAQLDKLNPQSLAAVCHITDGNHFAISDHFQEQGDYRYLRGKDLNSFFLEQAEEDAAFIPKSVFDGLTSSYMYPLDVLVSIVGTVGSVGIIPPDWPVVAGSCKLAVLRANEINPYYLAAFLSSKYGQFQTQRNMRGAVQMGLILDDFPHLRVPKPEPEFERKITELVKTAYKSSFESKQLYREAEQLLLDALNIQILNLSEELYNESTLLEALSAGRIDPDYYRPRYYRVLEAIRNSKIPVKTLGELIHPIRNGFDFRDYSDEGTPYIRVGDVKNGRIDMENAAKVPLSVLEIKKDVNLRTDDVLFTRKGTFGQAAVVQRGQENCIISSEIMLLRLQQTASVIPDYLSLFLNSVLGYQQVERKVHGIGYYSISQGDLATVEIPIISNPEQKRIAQIVSDSFAAEREAKNLLAHAKQKVEDLITYNISNG
ncbi:MAG: hypothetical protein DWQ04_28780 [Chloroflexi bacterium]|nr:MAG: hypothetical protein DWQ04_28780 [Chloroflexota bacterium]